MTTNEIHDLIQNCDHGGHSGSMHILTILERMNDKISELETRLKKAEGTARRAANTASCLANGIQPD